MRKVVAHFFIGLDGVVAVGVGFATADAVPMGRVPPDGPETARDTR